MIISLHIYMKIILQSWKLLWFVWERKKVEINKLKFDFFYMFLVVQIKFKNWILYYRQINLSHTFWFCLSIFFTFLIVFFLCEYGTVRIICEAQSLEFYFVLVSFLIYLYYATYSFIYFFAMAFLHFFVVASSFLQSISQFFMYIILFYFTLTLVILKRHDFSA